MDANQLKTFKKWVKFCKNEGFSEAKCGDFSFSKTEVVKKTKVSKKSSDKIEGLVHDPSAAMPNDSELLFYSTQSYDVMQENKKPQKAINEL